MPPSITSVQSSLFRVGIGSFPRRCQERGMLKRRKRCHHLYDGLLCKLKDLFNNTLYLHIFSYFHGHSKGKIRRKGKHRIKFSVWGRTWDIVELTSFCLA